MSIKCSISNDEEEDEEQTGLTLYQAIWRKDDLRWHICIAALPKLVWHPAGHVLLGVSGVIFLVLSLGLLLLIRLLSFDDLEMVHSLNPLAAKYLKRFARGKK